MSLDPPQACLYNGRLLLLQALSTNTTLRKAKFFDAPVKKQPAVTANTPCMCCGFSCAPFAGMLSEELGFQPQHAEQSDGSKGMVCSSCAFLLSSDAQTHRAHRQYRTVRLSQAERHYKGLLQYQASMISMSYTLLQRQVDYDKALACGREYVCIEQKLHKVVTDVMSTIDTPDHAFSGELRLQYA